MNVEFPKPANAASVQRERDKLWQVTAPENPLFGNDSDKNEAGATKKRPKLEPDKAPLA